MLHLLLIIALLLLAALAVAVRVALLGARAVTARGRRSATWCIPLSLLASGLALSTVIHWIA